MFETRREKKISETISILVLSMILIIISILIFCGKLELSGESTFKNYVPYIILVLGSLGFLVSILELVSIIKSKRGKNDEG